MRRTLAASTASVLLVAAIAALLVPLRAELSIATVGLIMVIPVVVAVVSGGYVAGLVGVAAGFVAWDLVFIPPYYTLDVGAGQNWVALGVYVVVMILVAQVVSRLQDARAEAQNRANEARRIFELSQLLVADRSLSELLESIVAAVRSVFDVAGAALLLPEDDRLRLAAAAGEVPDLSNLEWGHTPAVRPVAVGTVAASDAAVRTVALVAAGRPVGVLALTGGRLGPSDLARLQTFANHAALAVERAQLQAQALRTRLLEEVETLRRALLGAVSHDLRTPLAAMKVASSTLLAEDGSASADPSDRLQLYQLLDGEIDHLTRLVTGLLDLSRYQAGALRLAIRTCSVLDLTAEAVAGMRPSLGDRHISILVADDLPDVEADPVLIGQVLVNLIDNAHRHAPAGTPITVGASGEGEQVLVSVSDRGPGVAQAERPALFDGFVSSNRGGRAGMGLWICRAFVEAHGGSIWLDEPAGGGARFTFSLNAAPRSAALTGSGR